MTDAHTHFFPPEAAADTDTFARVRREAYWGSLVGARPDGRPSLQGFPSRDKFLRDMDVAGVEYAVIQGWYWENVETCKEQNDFVAEFVRAHPDRLGAFAAIQPASAQSLEIAARARDDGFCGLGELHDGVQKFSYDSPLFGEILDIAERDGLAVCLHITEDSPRSYHGKTPTNTRAALELARRRRGVNFIFAHWCGNLAFASPELFGDMPNAFFDCAAGRFTAPKNAFELAQSSPHLFGRAIYGTDYPLRLYPKLFACEEMKTSADQTRASVSEKFGKNLWTKNFIKAIKKP